MAEAAELPGRRSSGPAELRFELPEAIERAMCAARARALSLVEGHDTFTLALDDIDKRRIKVVWAPRPRAAADRARATCEPCPGRRAAVRARLCSPYEPFVTAARPLCPGLEAFPRRILADDFPASLLSTVPPRAPHPHRARPVHTRASLR